MTGDWNVMKRFWSCRRLPALWLAMLAVVLYAGCGLVTKDDGVDQWMEQAIASAASVAAEKAGVEGESLEAGGFVEVPSVEDQSAEMPPAENESKEVPSAAPSAASIEAGSPGEGFAEAPSIPSQEEPGSGSILPEPKLVELLDEDGSYTTCEDVALYLEIYDKLPGNFITKQEARSLGWEGGSLEPYAPGKCIGGDQFGNYEGLLPEAEGRSYRECDIDTLGADSRGAKRIVYSSDGLIYYTEDHYASFTFVYD